MEYSMECSMEYGMEWYGIETEDDERSRLIRSQLSDTLQIKNKDDKETHQDFVEENTK